MTQRNPGPLDSEPTDFRRRIPRTDAVLAEARLVQAAERLGADTVKRAVIESQQRARSGLIRPDDVVQDTVDRLPADVGSLQSVINATGVVLHTNLGRARLSAAAVRALQVAAGYVDVEFDVPQGLRARRGRGTLAALRAHVPDAEDVLVVNNGAAALLLAATALATAPLPHRSGPAAGQALEVIISRGELIEIGDGFRLPELIESAGARIREVGTTNRTSRADYADAVTDATAGILKIHPSNFRVEGFTSSVPIADLTALGVPVVADLGSGLLEPDRLLPAEPDVRSALRAGAGLVICSADKLLGGPQAGLLFGTAPLIETLRRHPMARALRVDKLTLAALEATLEGPPPPTARYLHAEPTQLRQRCVALLTALDAAGAAANARVVASAGQVGGGAAPGRPLPGWAISLPAAYAPALRIGHPPIIARVERERCLVDLRCVEVDQDAQVLDSLMRIAALGGNSVPRLAAPPVNG